MAKERKYKPHPHKYKDPLTAKKDAFWTDEEPRSKIKSYAKKVYRTTAKGIVGGLTLLEKASRLGR